MAKKVYFFIFVILALLPHKIGVLSAPKTELKKKKTGFKVKKILCGQPNTI